MTDIVIILFSLVCSSFFSGIEIAYVSSNRLKVEVVSQRFGSFFDFFLKPFKNDSFFFTTVLIGNNIALIVFSLKLSSLLFNFFSPIFPSNIELISFFIETIFCTTVIIIFGEFLPKFIFRLFPNKLIVIASPVLFISSTVFFPLVFIFQKATNLIIKLFNKNNNEKVEEKSKDLVNFLEETEKEKNNENAKNIKIIKNAIEFKDIKVRECMVPRNEITYIDINYSKKQINKVFLETGFSRIPVYEKNIDNLIGYIHYFDFFKYENHNIREIVYPLIFVSEAMMAKDLLKKLMNQEQKMAIVIDEYGETSGLITLEDVIEEIVGDIYDEHDANELLEKRIDNNTIYISARHETEYISEKYNLDITESDEYNTISGYIITKIGKIPEKNEEIKIEDLVFKIVNIENGKINFVTIKKTKKKNEPEN